MKATLTVTRPSWQTNKLEFEFESNCIESLRRQARVKMMELSGQLIKYDDIKLNPSNNASGYLQANITAGTDDPWSFRVMIYTGKCLKQIRSIISCHLYDSQILQILADNGDQLFGKTITED